MPVITPADLYTHLYPEIINEITREDNTITVRAIDAATQEAKLYLAKYDLVQLFGTETNAPTMHDALLDTLLKDIATWHLIRLSNVATDITIFRNAYNDALKTLKSIMAEQAEPQGWPYAPKHIPQKDGDSISWNSNTKRENHY